MTIIKRKSNQTNHQPIKSKTNNQIKKVRSKPVVIIPPLTTHDEIQSTRNQIESKLTGKKLGKTLYELPKFSKIDLDSISHQTRSKVIRSTSSLEPIKAKLKTNVEGSKRGRRPLGERDETVCVPIVVIPPYHEPEKKSTDPISERTSSLNPINLQTYSTTPSNRVPNWLTGIQQEKMIDPNEEEVREDSYDSFGLRNESSLNLTSSPSIEFASIHFPSNQEPYQSTSKPKEIHSNQSYSSTSQLDKSMENVMSRAVSKPISISNVPAPHSESSLEYIDPIHYNPTPTPPAHQSPSPSIPKPLQDSPKSSVSTIKRKRKTSNSISSPSNSILLDRNGSPISSQRDQQIHQELNDPFGFRANEKRLKVLRSKGELDCIPTLKPKSSIIPFDPSLKTHQNHVTNLTKLSTEDSDLSLTDLLAIKRPIKNHHRKTKANHRAIKNPSDSHLHKKSSTRSNENQVEAPLRRGRSKNPTIIIPQSPKNPTKDPPSPSSSLVSPKKLQPIDPNTLTKKRSQAHHPTSSPSPKKPSMKLHLSKKPKPKPKALKDKLSIRNSNQVSETSRELRVKYYDTLDEFDFEEEIVL